MNKFLIGVLVVFSILSVSVFGAVVGINNNCIQYEESVKAQYKQNQNNYDNYFKKVKEVAQIPDMYIEGLKEVYDKAMTGRYGADGSKAMFQWIQEQNPQVDASVYKQIQQVMESGRNDFESNQKMLIDKKRAYEVFYKEFPNSFVVGFLGFPKIDLNKYDIVTSEETENIFNSKKSEYIKI